MNCKEKYAKNETISATSELLKELIAAEDYVTMKNSLIDIHWGSTLLRLTLSRPFEPDPDDAGVGKWLMKLRSITSIINRFLEKAVFLFILFSGGSVDDNRIDFRPGQTTKQSFVGGELCPSVRPRY
jgi:hypothetical protein